MLAPAAGLVFVLLALQAGPPVEPDSIIRQAGRAVQGDSVDRMRSLWSSLIERDPDNRAARLGLAALDFYTYRYDDAADHYGRLSRSTASADAWSVRGTLGLAHIHHRRAELERADSLYVLASAQARAIDDSSAIADGLIHLATLRARTRGPASALSLFEEAAGVLPGAGDRQQALHRCARGLVFSGNDRVIDAQTLMEGARIAERAGETALQATCVFGLVARHMVTGASDSVRVRLDEVIALQRAAKDLYGLAGVLQRNSWYRRSVGSYAEAHANLVEALEYADLSGNASVEAWAALDLASISIALRDRVSSERYLDQAEQLFRVQEDAWGLGAVATTRAEASRLSGGTDATRAFYEEAILRNDAAGNALGMLGAHQALASIAMREGDFDRAAAHLGEARSIGEARGLAGWLRAARTGEAQVALGRGDPASAKAIIEELLASPHQPARRYELRALHALASVYEGDLDAAEAELSAAESDLEAWRSTLDDRHFRVQAFQPREIDGRVATIIAALARAGRIESALRFAEQRRARELADRIALARSITSDTGTAGDRVAPTSNDVGSVIDELRVTIGPDAALYYVTGEGDPTTLIIVTASEARAILLAPADSLVRPIERYRASLESGDEPASSNLARLLLGDALDDPGLSGVEQFVIFADGPLHRVPFAALRLGDGRYLIERARIATVPSVRVLTRLRAAARGPTSAALLVFGDPEFGEPAVSGDSAAYRPAPENGAPLPRLESSGREARRVARYASDSELRLGADASEAWLRATDLERFDVIHFATHALVDEQSITRAALVLAPGPGDDGFMGPAELSSLSLDGPLVVLSACRSAGGVVLRGEGIRGLTAPLFEAGARGIVATQWQIEDDAVVRLVDDFYRELAAGQDIGDAMRGAQLASIERGEPATIWAAFGVIGDPALTVNLRQPPRRGLLLLGLLPMLILVLAVARSARLRATV